ncbi:uncharacterized protein [Epargyreus clarus]|uniref:uncharacterized protein n=1 Tax=Epargyreus clarus TaxID=520877 RepID=UPI003C2D9263
MKFLVVFAAIAAVAFGYPPSTTWTLEELTTALQSPAVDPILKPYLEAALNEMMAALWAGEELTHITVPMPLVASYTLEQLVEAIQNPATHPAHIPYYEDALNELMLALHSGSDQQTITVVIPADLPMPVPDPIVVVPEAENVPEITPVDVATPVSSPLVQIIVNVNKQEQIADIVGVSPVEESEIKPTPVQVVEDAFVPVDHIAVNPIGVSPPIFPVRPIIPIGFPRPPAPLPGFGPMIANSNRGKGVFVEGRSMSGSSEREINRGAKTVVMSKFTMKFLVVFAAIAAVAFGYPPSTTWTLEELTTALQSPAVDPILKPYLEAALNEMMAALWAGEELTHITVPMPLVASYTLEQLVEAIQNPATHPAHIPYFEDALNELMLALHSGSDQQTITVVIPADLPMPVPDPVVVVPEAETAPEITPVDVATPVSSPLVQIIVNVNRQEQIADIVGVSPVEESEIKPTPVQVVEDAFVPEDHIAVNPIGVNPVDVIHPVRPILPIGFPRPPVPLPVSGIRKMKVFLLALFVAAAVAAPAPLEEEIGEPVELIVNGVAEGEPLELGDVLDLKVKEHADGQVVSSTNLLHPLTAAGLAEAAAAAEQDKPLPEIVEINPVPIELPEPVQPVPAPEAVVLPEPALPEIIPEPIDLPVPALPELSPPVLPEVDLTPAEVLPVPVPQLPTGEVFNDGVVQVTVNAGDPGVLSTIQSWFNMVLNYFNDGTQTTHQIV